MKRFLIILFFLPSRRILSFVPVCLWPVSLVLVSLLSCGKMHVFPAFHSLSSKCPPVCRIYEGVTPCQLRLLSLYLPTQGSATVKHSICSQVWLSPDLPGWFMVSPATYGVFRAKSNWNMTHSQCFCLNAAHLKTCPPTKHSFDLELTLLSNHHCRSSVCSAVGLCPHPQSATCSCPMLNTCLFCFLVIHLRLE